jgi:hypothetical protein
MIAIYQFSRCNRPVETQTIYSDSISITQLFTCGQICQPLRTSTCVRNILAVKQSGNPDRPFRGWQCYFDCVTQRFYLLPRISLYRRARRRSFPRTDVARTSSARCSGGLVKRGELYPTVSNCGLTRCEDIPESQLSKLRAW